jgi:glycosyltransferase involved in cell wall biosynthesis
MVDNNTQSGSKVPTLLFVGQINRKKNIPWLVNSVVDGVQSGALPQLRLILAGGKGYGFSEVEKVLKNVKGIVQWYPNPPLIDLVKMYCECTALVLPSLREGFGIPLLEAMYCGKPIIASKIPSTIEVAGEGPYYFSLGSKDEFFHAVRSALDDNNMQQRQLIYSNQLDRYSWKKVVNDYMRIYKEADSYK